MLSMVPPHIIRLEKKLRMFADKDASEFPDVGFQSSWRSTRSVANGSCQTTEVSFQEGEAQSIYVNDAETQTVEKERKHRLDKEEIEKQLGSVELKRFLDKSVPLLDDEIKRVLQSRAFVVFKAPDDETDDKNVQKLHTLDTKYVAEHDNADQSSLSVASLSWNASGSTVAVVYTMESHESWCTHETPINVWNIDRRDFDPGKPRQQITTDSCQSVSAFHSSTPSLLAVGSYTGDINVYNLALDGDMLAATTSNYGSVHTEQISGLKWINSADLSYRQQSSNSMILSAALDGKIVLWNYELTKVVATKVFLLTSTHIAKSLRGIKTKSSLEMGITALSLNYEDQSVVVIGTEAGALFQGSLVSEALVEGSTNNYDPVVSTFAGHLGGQVVDVKFSPFHRNVFLSVGSDQEIRVYSLLHPHNAIRTIFVEDGGVSSLSWSPQRPTVFAATGRNNLLTFFDLSAKSNPQILQIKASETSVPFPLTFTAFNRYNNRLLAAGDGFGRVHVWKLHSKLVSTLNNELNILKSMIVVEDD